MKILMLTPYVTINSHAIFSKHKTGFGYMVYDIACAIAQAEQVDVLALNSRGAYFEKDRVKFLKRTFLLYIRYCLKCMSPFVVFRLWKQYKMALDTFLQLIYYWFITGYLSVVIGKGNYDFVHIHGCGFSTELLMSVCKQCNIKYVITLHGLNSFSDTVRIESSAKQYERDFLKKVVNGEVTITVISTGMKRIIEKNFGVDNCRNIIVVCNSFSFSDNRIEGFSVRKRYNIPVTAKVLLYVGNLTENKNQLQMIESYALLPGELQRNTWVLFCGENHLNNNTLFKEKIDGVPYSNQIVLCGGIKKELMQAYYKDADAVVLLSKTEGFGLSLIEGMYFGLPCLMFTDMDAFEDIYDKNAVIGIGVRRNQSVADGIEKLLTNQWDKDIIKQSSKRFESKAMAQKYICVYKSLVV